MASIFTMWHNSSSSLKIWITCSVINISFGASYYIFPLNHPKGQNHIKIKKGKKIPKGKGVSNKTGLADFWITSFISSGLLEDSLYVSSNTFFFPHSHMETIIAYNCSLIKQGIIEIMIVIMNLRIVNTADLDLPGKEYFVKSHKIFIFLFLSQWWF